MLSAVRLAGFGDGITEVKILGSWLADRPAAGDDARIRTDRGWRQADRGERGFAQRLGGGGSFGGLPRPHRGGQAIARRRTRQNLGYTRRFRRRHGRFGTGEGRQGRAAGPFSRRGGRNGARGTVPPDRRGTCRKVEPVSLSDNGVLRNAQPTPDFRGRMTLCPEFPETQYRTLSPLHLAALSQLAHKIR
jgi:hypothetical protein